MQGAASVLPRMPFDGSSIEDIYVWGYNGALWWKWLDVNTGQLGSWISPSSVAMGSPPMVTSLPTEFPFENVYARALDGTLVMARFNVGTGQLPTWTSLGAQQFD